MTLSLSKCRLPAADDAGAVWGTPSRFPRNTGVPHHELLLSKNPLVNDKGVKKYLFFNVFMFVIYLTGTYRQQLNSKLNENCQSSKSAPKNPFLT
jgi:hypothetical protein